MYTYVYPLINKMLYKLGGAVRNDSYQYASKDVNSLLCLTHLL